MSSISLEDFMGDTYPIRNRILVTIFSQNFPYVKGSNKNFKDSGKILTDSQCDVDADYLKDIFKQIHYPETATVRLLNGRRKDDVTKYILGLDEKKENFDYDVFIFVFLTFMSSKSPNDSTYKDERIHLRDGLYPMQEFYDDAKKSEVMRMKPKIFLIQSDDLSLYRPKDYIKGEEKLIKKKIPQDADRLIIMSDIPQKLANPDEHEEEKHPSFLIKAFGETLKENSRRPVEQRLDLFSLTPMMNEKVHENITRIQRTGDLSVPLVTSTLTKLVKI